jgi:hypothetical protein
MGRVPGVPTEAGQCVYGGAEMARNHSSRIQDPRLFNHLHCSPRLWRHRQGDSAVHDFAAPKGSEASLL